LHRFIHQFETVPIPTRGLVLAFDSEILGLGPSLQLGLERSWLRLPTFILIFVSCMQWLPNTARTSAPLMCGPNLETVSGKWLGLVGLDYIFP